MAEVTLMLADTPDGRPAIRTTFKPAVGRLTTPAQSLALDMIRTARHQDATVQDAPELLEDLLAAAAQRDVLARLLARCLDPLRNAEAEAEGDGEDGGAALRDLIGQAEAALQALAQQDLARMQAVKQPELEGVAA